MDPVTKAPVAILAFNRPEYLQKTLRSLADQEPEMLLGREIHLFQDGSINPVSKCQYNSADIRNENVRIFLDIFPGGDIHIQEDNLGIALHFDFVERYLFEKRGFESAIFLEDDLTLSPLYLRVMDKLISGALSNDKIGCVAAYGNHRATGLEQSGNLSKIIPMEHRWAFATTRRQWLRQRPYIDEYLSIISKVDYQRRNHYEIIDWFTDKNVVPFVTSQDGVKGAFMNMTGAVGLMSYCCYGKYIGKEGIHWTAEVYEKAGFSATELCNEVPLDFEWPTDEVLEAEIKRAQKSFSNNLHHVKSIFPFYANWSKEKKSIIL